MRAAQAGYSSNCRSSAHEIDPTSRVPVKLSGQELQADNYAIAQMNAIIHDMEAELARGDTMINPKFRAANGKIPSHDIVVANPMWNQPFTADLFANDLLTASARQAASPAARETGHGCSTPWRACTTTAAQRWYLTPAR